MFLKSSLQDPFSAFLGETSNLYFVGVVLYISMCNYRCRGVFPFPFCNACWLANVMALDFF